MTEIIFYAKNLDDFGNIEFHEQYKTPFFDAGIDADGINVTFGDSVERIPAFLFCMSGTLEGSPNIKNVDMGKNIRSIGDFSFGGCRKLTHITIPDQVSHIGYGTFGECSGLTGELVIPNNVTTINSQAFLGCSGLTNVTIGKNVKNIGWGVFANCSGLTNVSILNSNISSQLFSGCTNLTNIIIGKNVAFISNSAFIGCDMLANVYYEGSESEWGKIIIEDNESFFNSVKLYYYSAEEPYLNQDGTGYNGYYWRYVDNIPTPWILKKDN